MEKYEEERGKETRGERENCGKKKLFIVWSTDEGKEEWEKKYNRNENKRREGKSK
jgi:hypothetical protein